MEKLLVLFVKVISSRKMGRDRWSREMLHEIDI